MADYALLYHCMVDASERALAEMDKQNYGRARELLIEAEQACEEQYIGEEAVIP